MLPDRCQQQLFDATAIPRSVPLIQIKFPIHGTSQTERGYYHSFTLAAARNLLPTNVLREASHFGVSESSPETISVENKSMIRSIKKKEE